MFDAVGKPEEARSPLLLALEFFWFLLFLQSEGPKENWWFIMLLATID